MITRLEATRYRCFERLSIDLGSLRMIVGPNGVGKTTLLDLPSVFGDLLCATDVGAAFIKKRPELPARARCFEEVLFGGRGREFSLVLEAVLPDSVAEEVRADGVSRLKSAKAQASFSFELAEEGALQVRSEYLFLFPEAVAPERSGAGIHGPRAKQNKHWLSIIDRDSRSGVEITPEAPTRKNWAAIKADVSPTVLSLPRVLYETSAEYPAARWLFGLLTEDAVFLEPDWTGIRLASPPGQPKRLISSGRKIALDLTRPIPSACSGSKTAAKATRWA
jgi:hypothetical protein